MKSINATLICTVLDEQKFIEKFIDSIVAQTLYPDEVIIVDGGSSDNTVSLINRKIKEYENRLNLKLFIKKGNRSVGRNFAIRNSKNKIILVTDAGCILDKKWVDKITTPFDSKSVDVVAGYYKGKPSSIFEKCLIPYVLVMPERVNPKEFLPATRSMALKKLVWEKVKGFDEMLSHNEDYAFANKLKTSGYKIEFVKDAIVYWIPRSNVKQAFKMFFRFAYGDAEAGLFRVKVLLIFLRYIIGFYLLSLIPVMKSPYLNLFICIALVSYAFWSVYKNYRYVKDIRAIILLPIIQFTADAAVILATLTIIVKLYTIRFFKYIYDNKSLSIIIFLYIILMLSMISWGIPNNNHPFNYFMDEWHQAQAIRNLFVKGSPNIAGSANGSIFQFYLSGLYLIPFILAELVKIFSIKSSVLNLTEQFRFFEILRLNTIIFGSISIFTFYYISKKYFKLPTFATLLFVFNPLWIMLSNYFKYDIALVFWILLSILFFIKYAREQTLLNFLLAGIFSALAFATKLSVEPLFIMYVLIFFLFTKDFKKRLSWLVYGVGIYVIIFAIFGIPDIILGKGSLYEYLTSNLVRTPANISAAFRVPRGIWNFLITSVYPSIFGVVFYFGSIISIVYILLIKVKEYLHSKNFKIFLQINSSLIIVLLSLSLFATSLYPLKLGASNNRVLVLIPFMAILFAFGLCRFLENKDKFAKYIVYVFIIVLFLLQLFQTYSWVYLKVQEDPRQISSKWITKNIKRGSVIGIENIPVYQALPDVVEKEFYLNQYNIKEKYIYKYSIINVDTKKFPNLVIITNASLEMEFINNSPKTKIITRLKRLGFKKIAEFKPDFQYLNKFSSPLSYYIAAIVQSPLSIDIYEKY